MVWYSFGPAIAVDPSAPGSYVQNATGSVYATSDTTYSSPLTLRAGGTTLVSNALGLIDEFEVENQTEVNWKSGSYVVRLRSLDAVLSILDGNFIAEAKIPDSVKTEGGGRPVGKDEIALNVFDFGAVPDVSADSTSSIQLALADVTANGGKVIIPAGPTGDRTVRIDGTVVIPRRVELEIAAGVTCLRGSAYTAATTPMFRLAGNNAKLTGSGRIETQNASTNGVVLFGPPDLTTLANVLSAQMTGLTVAGVKSAGNIGLRFWSSFVAAGGATYQNVVRDVTVDGFGTGVYVSDVANANEFHGVQCKNILNYCFDFYGNTASRGADECAIIGGFVHASTDVTVVRMRNCYSNHILGLRAEPGGASALPYDLDSTTISSVIVMTSNMASAGVDANGGNLAVINGKVLSLQGSAAAPGMTFTGDTATGFYRQSAQVLSATTGGVERWRLGTNLSMLTNLQLNTNYLELTQRGSTPSTPGAGVIRMFMRSSDGALCFVDSTGTVRVVNVT